MERKNNAPEIQTQELPEGLSLAKSGNLFGTTSIAGAYKFTVQASNSYAEDKREYELVLLFS